MGVQLDIWRARIGLFSQPRKYKCKLDVIVVKKGLVSLTLRIFVFLSLLVCGDVEANPGPPKLPPPAQTTGQAGRTTRQSSYFSQQDSNSQNNNVELSNASSAQTQDEMFSFLRNMKKEMDEQNDTMKSRLTSIDIKMDSLTDSISDLRRENDQLKESNIELRQEMKDLKSKIDSLESHSRRTNLRIKGIPGSETESWDETEKKVRDFINFDLGLPEKKDVDIERAHRIRSGGQHDNTTVIVKFSRYKDCQAVLKKSTETFDRHSRFSVQQDYTDRVKRHRRELGKELVTARENGRYAAMRYDKLFIDNKVYKYDDATDSIVCIGNRFRAHHGNQDTEPRDRQRDQQSSQNDAPRRFLGATNTVRADDPDDVIQ